MNILNERAGRVTERYVQNQVINNKKLQKYIKMRKMKNIASIL